MEALFEELAVMQAANQVDSQMTADSVPRSSPAPPDSLPHLPPRSPLERSSSPISAREATPSQRFISLLPQTQDVERAYIPPHGDLEAIGYADQINLAVSNQIHSENNSTPRPQKRGFDDFVQAGCEAAEPELGDSQQTNKSFSSTISIRDSTVRRDAYFQMLANMNDDDWAPIGLISTNGEHTKLDQEL